MTRTASCHCGSLEIDCAGDPVKVSLCHCFDCQRRTGSLFSVAAFWSRETLALPYEKAKEYRRSSASGFDVSFYHCPVCGSTVWWEPARMPHWIGIAVGSFADPTFAMPEQAVWESEQHLWLRLPDTLPSYSRNPPARKA